MLAVIQKVTMYYPEEVVQQVIEANDIVDVIGQYVSLKKSGSSFMGLCPFHNEKSPSFSVSQSKQFFHCFGCGEGGNVITFLMKYENYSFQEALKVLADRAGIKLPEAHYSEQARQKAQQKEALLAMNKAAATYYYKLLRSPKGEVGLSYFQKRELSTDTMNRFGLGFADGAHSDMVAYLRQQGFSDENILLSGIAAFDEKRGLHDKFWNRVIFPIMDVTNRVIGFGGRVMGDGKPKYLNSPETPVFDKSRNLYGLNIAKKTKAPYFILCEGYMDTIAMHQAGFDMAVASLGTAFTEQQAQILKRYGKHVLLDYDSDGAGVKAALRNIGILRSVGIQPKVIDMRPAKDADEFMKTLGREKFQERIDQAENSFFYEIRMIESSFRMDDPASRTEFYHEIARRLCGFADELERENYIKAMADKYYIPIDSLRREVATYQNAGAGTPGGMPDAVHMRPQNTAKPKPKSPTEGKRLSAVERGLRRNERLLLTWLSDQPGLYLQIRNYIQPSDFDEGVYRTAATKYFAMLERHFGDELNAASGVTPGGEPSDSLSAASSVSPASVIGIFDEEEDQKEAAEMFATRIPGITDKAEREKALKDVILAVKNASLARAMQREDGGSTNFQEILTAKRQLQAIQRAQFRVS